MSQKLRLEFQRWSRWYPKQFRERNNSAMLGTYLDVAEEEGHEQLSTAEKAALLGGGLNARLDAVVPGEIRARAATVMIGLLGAFGLVSAVCFEWAPWAASARARYFLQLSDAPGATLRDLTFGPFLSPYVIVAVLALACCVTCFAGPTLLYRSMLGATIVAAIVIGLIAHFAPPTPWMRPLPCLFIAIVGAMALMAPRPTPRRTGISTVLWMLAFTASFVFASAVGFGGPHWWDPTKVFDGFATVSDFFFRVVPASMAYYGVLVALLVATGVRIARRRSTAATIVVSTLPWSVVALLGESEFRSGAGLILLSGCYAAAIAFALGMRGSRQPERVQG
ncbi:hypothetical protein GCM10027568_14770 [Humibacter soli]